LMWSYSMWPTLTPGGIMAGILIQVTESTPSHEQIAAVNQALIISALKQHELTERAEALNTLLEADAVLLQKSANALQRANCDLERFTSVASHDLQEPLRTVTAYTQLLARQMGSRLQAKDQVLMQFIVDGSRRMSALIKDLLTYARVGTEDGTSRQHIDCNLALQEALANLKGSTDDAQAVITSDALPTLDANFPQIVSVFQNLVGNALKYRKSDDSPNIHIAAVYNEAEWTFSVADKGIGFDQKYGDNIFGVFKRLHGNKYPGTGIGLAICQRVVNLHGGRIWATGVEGVGATFFFTLPQGLPVRG
jgi:light-regulated signal transduction histidine kinase (bacteriophytochrome)